MPVVNDKISVSQLYSTPISQVQLYPVLTFSELLLTDPMRRHFLEKLKKYSGLEESLHQTLYEITITQFAELVQILPAQFGGKPCSLMDGSLERASTALRHYHQSTGANFSHLYAYALFTAALFQDVGKIISQQAVMLSDEEGKFIAEWSAFAGSMVTLKAKYYKLRPIDDQWISLGQSVTPLLARQYMPPLGFEWIASDYKIFSLWMGVLTGEAESEGELLHWLQLSHKLIRLLPQRDRLKSLEVNPTRPIQTALGEDFLSWLIAGLADGTIPVNADDANVHVLAEGGILLEPGIFQLFSKIYGRSSNWTVICKQFNMLGITKLSGDDYEFEKFFSKSMETLSVENAIRNPKGGMFFGGNINVVSGANIMREGLVVAKAQWLYRNMPIPSASNLVSASGQAKNNTLAFIQTRANSAERYLLK